MNNYMGRKNYKKLVGILLDRILPTDKYRIYWNPWLGPYLKRTKIPCCEAQEGK